MKKKILTALIAVLLILPQGAFAETTPNLTKLEFSKLEFAMRSYNPTISLLYKSYNSSSTAMDDTSLKNLQTLLVSQLAKANDTLDDATVNYTTTPYTVTDVRSRYIIYDPVKTWYLYNSSGLNWSVITPAVVVTAPQLTGNR